MRILGAAAGAAALLAPAAGADAVDRVRFRVEGRVMVWVDEGAPPLAGRTVRFRRPAGSDAKAGGIRFAVASNTGFTINAAAAAGLPVETARDTLAIATVASAGPLARAPGETRVERSLAALGDSPLYRMPARTAAAPGPPHDQAVVFEIRFEPPPVEAAGVALGDVIVEIAVEE